MLRNSEKEVEQNSRFSPGYRMIDSGRRSDLFRRYGVSAPLRCAPASPSSRFLISTENLCRGQVFLTAVIGFLSQCSLAQKVARVAAA